MAVSPAAVGAVRVREHVEPWREVQRVVGVEVAAEDALVEALRAE